MTWYQDLHPTTRDEAAYIVQEFAKEGIAIGGVRSEDNGIAFMYQEGQLLAREQHLESIRRVLVRHDAQATVTRRVIKDIVLLEISHRVNHDRSAEGDHSAAEGNDENRDRTNSSAEGNEEATEGHYPDVIALLEHIDADLGPGIATPNQVVTVAGMPNGGQPSPCPATEPQEVYGGLTPYPPVCKGVGGARVRIWVADTGVINSTVSGCNWLNGVTGESDPRIQSGTIMPYGGHGTFVAGVIRSMAPGAEIRVENVFKIAGSALEADFVPKLYEGFRWGAEIFHLTVASPTRHHLPLIAFEAWMEDLRQHKGVVCVVAAGNNGDRMPCWPAAFPGLVSVGALAADWSSRAYFSNFGGWVDVYAPGQNLVNAFATGSYTCHVAPYVGEVRTFTGMCQWSGTSFSTPIVTGLIAARMARCGESGQEAAAALLAKAGAQAIPGTGPVLLPCCDEDDGCGCGHGRRGGDGGGCGGGCGDRGRGDCGRCGGGRRGCGCGR